MARTRSYRRAQDTRAKARARRTIALWYRHCDAEYTASVVTPAFIGKMAAVGCRPCSCSRCRYDEYYPQAAQVRADDDYAAQIDDEFGTEPPAYIGPRGPVTRDSFEYHRSMFCCEDCDGSWEGFLRTLADCGVEVPQAEWDLVAERKAAHLQYEIDRAYSQRDDQLYAEQGFIEVPDEPSRPWKGSVWVFPTDEMAVGYAVQAIQEAA